MKIRKRRSGLLAKHRPLYCQCGLLCCPHCTKPTNASKNEGTALYRSKRNKAKSRNQQRALIDSVAFSGHWHGVQTETDFVDNPSGWRHQGKLELLQLLGSFFCFATCHFQTMFFCSTRQRLQTRSQVMYSNFFPRCMSVHVTRSDGFIIVDNQQRPCT